MEIREQYEAKIEELEFARQAAEDEKDEVEGYKDLLTKQREVMVSLSRRLAERDARIIELEEDIEMLEESEFTER